jgi:hypothetical protein
MEQRQQLSGSVMQQAGVALPAECGRSLARFVSGATLGAAVALGLRNASPRGFDDEEEEAGTAAVLPTLPRADADVESRAVSAPLTDGGAEGFDGCRDVLGADDLTGGG